MRIGQEDSGEIFVAGHIWVYLVLTFLQWPHEKDKESMKVFSLEL